MLYYSFVKKRSILSILIPLHVHLITLILIESFFKIMTFYDTTSRRDVF